MLKTPVKKLYFSECGKSCKKFLKKRLKSKIGSKNQNLKESLKMNKNLKSFLTKIILFTLTGFFHFSSFAWDGPSESNCTDNEIMDDLDLNSSACRIVDPDTGAATPSPCQDREKLEIRKGKCDRWEDDRKAAEERERDEAEKAEEREREEAKELEKTEEAAEQQQLDFAKEQADKMEKAREDALKEQQKIMDTAKQECISSYDQVVRQRDRIESEVQRKQQEMDSIEDEITGHYASISQGEDKVRDQILQLKQTERQVMGQFKDGKTKMEQDEKQGDRGLQEEIEKIENDLADSTARMEDIADFKEQICSGRSSEYLKLSVECYNEALKTVTAEREELFKRIRTGQYEASSVSNLFQMDSQNIDQTFKKRMTALHTYCFQEKTGESLPPQPGRSLNVKIPCDLKAFEQRASICKKNNNNRRICPVKPHVQAIEQKALAQLKQMEKDKKKLERARKMALKGIEKLKKQNKDGKEWIANRLADLEENMRLAKKDFEEKHERAENELKRVREKAENNILRLERNKIRLLASDPARHFEEQIIVARVACCNSVNPQQTVRQCTLLGRYEQDANRFQFAFIRPLPALRSTSGPTNSRSGSTSGGVQ